MGEQSDYDQEVIKITQRLGCDLINKDFNANTITLYLNDSLKKVNRLKQQLQKKLPTASIQTSKVALASAMGSDMRIKGFLSTAVQSLSKEGINIEAIHQNTRQVEMQFYVSENDYEKTINTMHQNLIAIHNHGSAICKH